MDNRITVKNVDAKITPLEFGQIYHFKPNNPELLSGFYMVVEGNTGHELVSLHDGKKLRVANPSISLFQGTLTIETRDE